MGNEYDLDNLIKTFQEHADKYDKEYDKNFREQEYFNLPKALLTFAKEMKQLKEKINDQQM